MKERKLSRNIGFFAAGLFIALLFSCNPLEGYITDPSLEGDKDKTVTASIDDYNLEELAAALKTLPKGSAEAPSVLKLTGEKILTNASRDLPTNTVGWGKINDAVAMAGKYVILDLSACSFMDDTIIGHDEKSENYMNVIHLNAYIKGIVLPESLKYIKDKAFSYCSYLTSVVIPYGVELIEQESFVQAGLTSVTIPSSVETITSRLFSSCDDLENVTISSGVKIIEDSAFFSCVNIKRITIPESVTGIRTKAFANCNGLTSVTFTKTGVEVGDNAFPQGGSLDEDYGEILKTVYETGGAETYTRSPDKNDWSKFVDTVSYINDLKNRLKVIANYTSENNPVPVEIPASTLSNANSAPTNTVGWGEINAAVAGAKKYVILDLSTCTFENDTVTGGAYEQISGNDMNIIKDNEFVKGIVLPSGLTIIGDNALYLCSYLTRVTIPATVTEIGKFAFMSSGLTSVTIPASITNIGVDVFADCPQLTRITVRDDNAHYASVDGVLFNKDKTVLMRYPEGKIGTTYTIPGSVMEIGYDAFFRCSGLTKVNIPNSITSIKDSAFLYCSGLTSLTIPSSVKIIGNSAFSNCSGLTSVTFIKNNVTIGNNVFPINDDFNLNHGDTLKTAYLTGGIGTYARNDSDWTKQPFSFADLEWYLPLLSTGSAESPTTVAIRDNFTNEDTVPAGYVGWGEINVAVEKAGKYVILDLSACTFEGNTVTSVLAPPGGNNMNIIEDNEFVKGIGLPSGLTTIGMNAFSSCSNLTSVTISTNVTEIENFAFMGSGLTDITIPARVAYIGIWVFGSFMTDITVESANTKYSSVDGVLFNKNKTVLKDYPRGKGETTYTIPGSVTEIGYRAFEGHRGLTSVIIPEGVTKIGDNAFTSCTGFTSITIPESVTEIGFHAFRSCENLASVIIPEAVTDIRGLAFSNCRDLKSVTFNGNDVEIGEYAFPISDDYSQNHGNTLRTAYTAADGGAGTYTRSAGGSDWTKQP